MRILDKYILKSIISIFLSTIFLFCFLYVLIDVASRLNDFLDNQVPIRTIIDYYMTFLPIIIVHTSPIACLIASLFTYSSLNNTNEIIALRAGGLDFWQITKPALCFALIVSAFVFLVNERYVPQSTLQSEEIKDKQLEKNMNERTYEKNKPIPYLTFYGLKNRLFFIDEFQPKTNRLQGIILIEHDTHQNVRLKYTAPFGDWTDQGWVFKNVQISTYPTGKPNESSDLKFERELLMDISETPEDFMKQRLDVNAMNIAQLNEYIKRFKASGATSAINSLLVDLHSKIAYPIGSFVVVLIGLPFGLMIGRRKALTFTSVGIAAGIGFLYYISNAVGLALGKGGALHPILSAWFAPLLFLVGSLYVILKKF